MGTVGSLPPGRIRIAVIGAGAVGSTIAYVAMLRGIAHELVLVRRSAGILRDIAAQLGF